MVITRSATTASEKIVEKVVGITENSQGLPTLDSENIPKVDSVDLPSTTSMSDNTPSTVAPEWFQQYEQRISQKLSQLDTLGVRFSTIEEKLDEYQKSIDFACNAAKDVTERVTMIEKTAASLQNENAILKRDNERLTDRLVQLDSQSKRNNLIFNGVDEKQGRETWEQCEETVRQLICNNLKVQEGPSIKFERVHRNGEKKADKKRSIIAKFSNFKERDLVWNNRRKLSGSQFSMSEDFPIEIQNERKLLFPILKVVKTLQCVTSASIKFNKLYINGRWYTKDTIDKLPPEINLQSLFTKSENGVTLFCSKYSPLSNLYSESDFTIDGETYCSSEQYIQWRKAMLFNDEISAARIKAERNPYAIMGLGKKVKDFKLPTWKKECPSILKTACAAKIQQVPIARKALIETGDNVIGEATLDKNFGIGLNITDTAALIPDSWPGDNQFGKILMEIRNEVKKQAQPK